MPSEETASLTNVRESNEAGLGRQPRSTTGNPLGHSPSQGLGESNARPDDKAENPASGTPEVEDHPDGDEIRRQVEYYFSDENLPTDKYLLEFCRGKENLPVSVGRICSFKKMRHYKPRKQVVAALRKSDFLDVSEDGKTIKRKIPLEGPTILDDNNSDSDSALRPESTLAAKLKEAKKAKKAKKLVIPHKDIPAGMTKNMIKPHGFEEYYADGPITPAEFKEEESMYDPSVSFIERIEIAIQRFKQKRRMHEIYSQVFNKWMKFGGVDSAPRQFTGRLTQEEMEGKDAGEIARMMATHQVDWDREDEEQWAVDFEGVAKAFLSSYYPACFSYSAAEVKRTTQVLRSFYNYLLHHNVCPEHESSILAARRTCDLADHELPAIRAAGISLSGSFNVACSSLFGGFHSTLYTGDKGWADTVPPPTASGWDSIGMPSTVGMRGEEAAVVFKTGIVAYGTEAQYDFVTERGIAAMTVLRDELVGLEIASLVPAPPDICELYTAQNDMWAYKLSLTPLGKMRCVPWAVPSFDEWDLPATKRATLRDREYEFWVEDKVLDQCFVGMKMEARVMELSCGIWVLDSVCEVHCSFFTWLPNELLMEKRPKEVVWLKSREAQEAERAEAGEGEGGSGGLESGTGDESAGLGGGVEVMPGNREGEDGVLEFSEEA